MVKFSTVEDYSDDILPISDTQTMTETQTLKVTQTLFLRQCVCMCVLARVHVYACDKSTEEGVVVMVVVVQW